MARFPGASGGHLIEAVISRIEGVFADVRVPAHTGDLVPIRVIRSMIDPARYAENDLPAMVVHYGEMSQRVADTGGEERVCGVDLSLGIFMQEYGDDEFAIALMERLEQDFLSQRIFDRKYRLVLPLTWKVADQQPWPYWWATMSADFLIPAISEVRDEEGAPFEM